MEALQKRYGAFWSVTEHYAALQDVAERYGTVTENIDVAYH